MHPPFLIGEAFRFGWHKTRAHSGVLFQVMVALFAVQVAYSVVEKVLGYSIEGILAQLALGVLSIILGAGFTVITLKLAKSEHATYRDLVPPGRLVWTLFLASVLTGLIIVGGLILFIVPGVYFLTRYSMVRFVVIEGATVGESLKKSSHLTEGVKWRLLGFLLALLGLNVAGAAFFLVGLLLTVPVSAIAYAHVYLKLKNHPHHAAH